MTPRFIMLIATGIGVGYLPVASGTWGSLVALPIHFLLTRLGTGGYLVALGLLVFVAVGSAGAAEKILDRADPSAVVIDEIAGMLVTLAPFQPGVLTWGAGFLLFRFFDIVKPFPVRWFDRHIHGGIGIVADDLVAGLYAAGCLWLLTKLVG